MIHLCEPDIISQISQMLDVSKQRKNLIQKMILNLGQF